MTRSKAVAKARRELDKILTSDYAHLSNEYFRVGKLQKFIKMNKNGKGQANTDYHRENDWIEKELNGILAWDRSQLNIYTKTAKA